MQLETKVLTDIFVTDNVKKMLLVCLLFTGLLWLCWFPGGVGFHCPLQGICRSLGIPLIFLDMSFDASFESSKIMAFLNYIVQCMWPNHLFVATRAIYSINSHSGGNPSLTGLNSAMLFRNSADHTCLHHFLISAWTWNNHAARMWSQTYLNINKLWNQDSKPGEGAGRGMWTGLLALGDTHKFSTTMCSNQEV